MNPAAIDAAIEDLQDSKKRWANLSVSERIAYLVSIRDNTIRVARPWVEAAVAAKDLSMDHPYAGEEWTSGPFSVFSQAKL